MAFGAIAVVGVVALISSLALIHLTSTDGGRPGDSYPTARSGDSADGLRVPLADVTGAQVPGVIVSVQDGDKSQLTATGVTDLAAPSAALRPQARFRVGSVTKTFVATVVLQLAGQGKLRLDEPIEQKLPGLLSLGSRITVRELLNHTSGLFDYATVVEPPIGGERHRIYTPRELVAIAEQHPPLFPPGTSWAYSNTNYIVAGMLIEAVTHHRLDQELEYRIFAPLKLRDTSFPVATGSIEGYYAHGYISPDSFPALRGRPFDITGLNSSIAGAAGGVISTATDLSRFYRELLTGKLLNPDLLRQMKTTVAQDPANPNHFRYGLGIERVEYPCGAEWGHGGSIFGYKNGVYWNERTGRTVVVAGTMFPMSKTARAAFANLTDVALCGPRDESR
jgi:D-alanyl-D-alanine carboxypeptidase